MSKSEACEPSCQRVTMPGDVPRAHVVVGFKFDKMPDWDKSDGLGGDLVMLYGITTEPSGAG